jgi:hypothetical protein
MTLQRQVDKHGGGDNVIIQQLRNYPQFSMGHGQCLTTIHSLLYRES